jgi:hypothetical protein
VCRTALFYTDYSTSKLGWLVPYYYSAKVDHLHQVLMPVLSVKVYCFLQKQCHQTCDYLLVYCFTISFEPIDNPYFINYFFSGCRRWPVFFSFFFFIFLLLFICAYKDWFISPHCPHPLPYHPLHPLPLPPPQYPAETILPLSLILLKREYKQ